MTQPISLFPLGTTPPRSKHLRSSTTAISTGKHRLATITHRAFAPCVPSKRYGGKALGQTSYVTTPLLHGPLVSHSRPRCFVAMTRSSYVPSVIKISPSVYQPHSLSSSSGTGNLTSLGALLLASVSPSLVVRMHGSRSPTSR